MRLKEFRPKITIFGTCDFWFFFQSMYRAGLYQKLFTLIQKKNLLSDESPENAKKRALKFQTKRPFLAFSGNSAHSACFKQLYIKIFILTQKLFCWVCWVAWKCQKQTLLFRTDKGLFWSFQVTQQTNFWVSMNILM